MGGVAMVSFMLALSGDPIVDSYPADVVDRCRSYWIGLLPTKAFLLSHGGPKDQLAEVDARLRQGMNTCIEVQRRSDAARDAALKVTVQTAPETEAQAAARAEANRIREAQAVRKRALDEEYATRNDTDEQNKANPSMMRPVLSAKLCAAQEDRTKVLRAIAEERKYARVAGVVNLGNLESLKDDLRSADEAVATARIALRPLRATALPCTRRDVQLLQGCLDARVVEVGEAADAEDLCSDPRMQAYVRISR